MSAAEYAPPGQKGNATRLLGSVGWAVHDCESRESGTLFRSRLKEANRSDESTGPRYCHILDSRLLVSVFDDGSPDGSEKRWATGDGRRA